MRRICLGVLLCASLWAQHPVPAPAPSAAHPEATKDPLGRNSPRGTVLGFLTAARKGNMEGASQYLNTPLRAEAAQRLAQQLFTVLDRRLPARLMELSDSPEGSLSTLKADQDLVGTISSAEGGVDILVERVARGRTGSLWLFSKETLDRIPELFRELNEIQIDSVVPRFLLNTRIAGILLFQWLFVFVGLPAIYFLTVLLNWILGLLVRLVRRAENKTAPPNPKILPVPVRLLLVTLAIYGMLSKVALPLLGREFWVTTANLIAIAGCVSLSIFLNGKIENHIRRRLVRAGRLETSSVIRLVRRMGELLLIFAGLLAALYLFGFSPTTALAGLGIGGIAVALAAQKTLENVIGGVSLVFDRTVLTGDTLQVGNTAHTMSTLGTIEEIGLRSTKVRTRDRSVISIPNGQLATLSLENLSARDKFLFHPNVRLRYDTTAAQLRSILAGLENLLARHPRVERESISVRFLEFGASSLELEVSAYVMTKSRLEFLEIQEELLLQYMEIVEAAGAQIALQAPMYVVPTFEPPSEQLTLTKSKEG